MSLTFNRIRERVSFELGKEIEKDGFRLVTSVGQKKNFFRWYMRNRTSDLRIPRSAALPCIFVFFLCTFFRSYSINKHDAIDTANLSSMQDACHMNLVIDLAHRRVFVVQW